MSDSHDSDEAAARALEHFHVHAVYDAIAPHFSATRYKPWPMVASFLEAQPAGAVGLDVGCGNGKYLGVNGHVFMLGFDMSGALAKLAREKLGRRGSQAGRSNDAEIIVADTLSLPFRPRAADFAICIAVIHHLSTRARRQQAIRQLLQCVKKSSSPGRDPAAARGKVLLYVWALEQASSRRGWDEGSDQDLLVSWVMKQKQQQQSQQKFGQGGTTEGKGQEHSSTGVSKDAVDAHDKVFQRYYHLFRKGELEEDVVAAQGEVLESGYDRDNWWLVAADTSDESFD